MTNFAPSDAPALADALGGTVGVADFVRSLAHARGVDGTPTALDRFAADVSRLSDAEVPSDGTEDLIAALVRAKILTPAQGLQLQHQHLKQVAA